MSTEQGSRFFSLREKYAPQSQPPAVLLMKNAVSQSDKSTETARLLSKDKATEAVSKIARGIECLFELKPHSEVNQNGPGKRTRSKKYEGWRLLMHVNSNCHAGWLVCPFFANGVCPLNNALRKYHPGGGGTNS